MSTETMIEMLFGVLLTFVGVQAILHEREFIRFERKLAKYIKAFFKAIYLTIKEKRDEKAHM